MKPQYWETNCGRRRGDIVGLRQASRRLWLGFAEHPHDLLELRIHVLGVGLGEDRADDRDDHLCAHRGATASTLGMKCTRHRCQAAPWNTVLGCVGEDELDLAGAAGLQGAQELGPEHLILAVAHVETEHLTSTVVGDTERDDDRLGHDPVGDLALNVQSPPCRHKAVRRMEHSLCPAFTPHIGANPARL